MAATRLLNRSTQLPIAIAPTLNISDVEVLQWFEQVRIEYGGRSTDQPFILVQSTSLTQATSKLQLLSVAFLKLAPSKSAL
jgi:hypothetical protein